MKKLTLITAFVFCYFLPQAQQGDSSAIKDNQETIKRLQLIEDQLALKQIVDEFSILADTKETEKQTLLFTEDALLQTYIYGKLVTQLKGRKQIGEAFAAYLKNFEIVYHMNGQQTVHIDGDKAKGTSYCLVTLIGYENKKKVMTTNGVHYQDDFAKVNGKWLIVKRVSTFAWQDKKQL